MLCVCTFSFGLPRKKKIPKRKRHRLRLRSYSDTAIAGRGSNSLRSNNRPFPGPDSACVDAPATMPEGCAVIGEDDWAM